MALTTTARPASGRPAPAAPRNPGPSWGYRFLRTADQILPEPIYRPLRGVGTAIALARMPEQRRHSRAYLRQVLGREPRAGDVFRHFFAFEEALMLRLRVANGRHVPCRYGPGTEDFAAWMGSDTPAFLGTMHIGVSDTLGFQLAGKSTRPIFIVRQRVANSHDTEALCARFGERLRLIWVNEGRDLLFELKSAVEAGGTVALQCDRLEFSTRTEAFEFLGARRLFSVTIYHLALLFDRPVLLAVGVPDGPNATRLHASPRFTRHAGEGRAETLARAHDHFQAFLRDIERLLRASPYWWFNFTPLNPSVAG